MLKVRFRVSHRLRSKRQKGHFSHKSNIVLSNQEIAFMIQGDSAHLTDAGFRRIIKPCAIAGVRAIAIPIQEQVYVTSGVDVPNLAAAVSRHEKGAGWQTPDGPNFIQGSARG